MGSGSNAVNLAHRLAGCHECAVVDEGPVKVDINFEGDAPRENCIKVI